MIIEFDLDGTKIVLLDDVEVGSIYAKLPSEKEAIWFNDLLHKHNDSIALSA